MKSETQINDQLILIEKGNTANAFYELGWINALKWVLDKEI